MTYEIPKETKAQRRLRRQSERIGKVWRRIKKKVSCCPDCFETRPLLCANHYNIFRKYNIECGNCGWCGKAMPTIRLAIDSWNNQMPTSAHLYQEEPA